MNRPYRLRWAALAVLSSALLLTVMANTSMTVLATDLQADLDASAAETRWILDAYPLVVAALLLFFGAAGDRYGRRIALLAGLTIFSAASIAGALMTSAAGLIATRALIGVGGALIMPATLAYVRVLFPPEERGRAFAIWSGSAGIALVAGPLLSGALVGPFGWQAAFWMNVVFGAVLIAAARVLVPPSRNEHAPRLDVLGALLSCLVAGPLTFGVIEGPSEGWTSALVLGSFALAVVALVAFIAHERRAAHPMLDLRWFRERSFAAGAGLALLGFTIVIGLLYVTVLYLQQHEGHDAWQTGVELLPLGGGIVAGAGVTQLLLPRLGRRAPALLGVLVLAAGAVVLSTVASGYGAVAVALALAGLGAGLFLPNATEAVMDSAPDEAGGVAGATADAAVELGAALGIATLGSVLTTVYSGNLPAAAAQLPDAASDSLLGAQLVAQQLPAEQGALLLRAAGEAFVDGMSVAALVAAGIAVAALLVAVALPGRAHARRAVAREAAQA